LLLTQLENISGSDRDKRFFFFAIGMQQLRAQGATEYLVLLAVVLIVALVSVALLGFFPGMASDAQLTQSKTYWQSAQPISITETAAMYFSTDSITYPYLKLRNSGVYPIRITGLIGGDGVKMTNFAGGFGTCGTSSCPGCMCNVSDYFYMGPGEEKGFIYANIFGAPGSVCDWRIFAITTATNGMAVGGATSVCQNSATAPGTLQFSSFGFEYIEYLDNGQQITKRQIGKPLIIKCRSYP